MQFRTLQMNSLYGVYAIILHFQLFQVRCEYLKQRIASICQPCPQQHILMQHRGYNTQTILKNGPKKEKNPPTLGSKQQVTQCLIRATLSSLPGLSFHLIENIQINPSYTQCLMLLLSLIHLTVHNF